MRIRSIRHSFVLLIALLFAFAGSPWLLAQTNTTSLSGVITDPTGALIPQVAVELTNPATGFIKVIKSDSRGAYSSDQVFNILNTNRFASVQTSGVSPNFGVYLNSNTTPAVLLQPRPMQFSGKYIF